MWIFLITDPVLDVLSSPPGTHTPRTCPLVHPVDSHPPAQSDVRSSELGSRPSPPHNTLRCAPASASCRSADASGPYKYSDGTDTGEKSLVLYSATASATGARINTTIFREIEPSCGNVFLIH